jgi:sugar-specific transcriptional regulator TrmB/DNA-binding CsgD family transcriptional regulator
MKKNSVLIESADLSALGVSAVEERIYVELLGRDGASAPQLAKALGGTPRTLARALNALQEKGLVTHSPQSVRRYFAVSPDIAINALIERRKSELNHSRAAIQRLHEASKVRRGRHTEERLVDVLSAEASIPAISRVIRSAQSEILWLERLPLVVSPSSMFADAQAEAFARGVKSRSVADSNLLRVPGILEPARRDIESGEEKRVFPNLPIKLMLVDRRVAFIPLSLESAAGSFLQVRSSALLAALYELFDMFWRLATPITFDRSGRLAFGSAHEGRENDEREQLLSLLSSGLNDKTIEQELQISSRTFTRRVAALMKELGATSRFHAGWLAAKSGANSQ